MQNMLWSSEADSLRKSMWNMLGRNILGNASQDFTLEGQKSNCSLVDF